MVGLKFADIWGFQSEHLLRRHQLLNECGVIQIMNFAVMGCGESECHD
jgi:hypothetical protein